MDSINYSISLVNTAYFQDVSIKIVNAYNQNESINTNNIFEENEQIVNRYFAYSFISPNSTLLDTLFQDIVAVAQQCPLTGGMSVL